MDTQKEQQRKRRESKRKRNRKPALLIVAGIALALLVLLLVRWNRPLTEIALQKGEPDRMDAAKDFLLFANDKTLTAKNANGKEPSKKPWISRRRAYSRATDLPSPQTTNKSCLPTKKASRIQRSPYPRRRTIWQK